jgi:acyl carrier protein
MGRSGLEQVRQWTGSHRLHPIEIITDGKAPQYASLAQTDPSIREAAQLFAKVENQIDLGNGGAEMVTQATEALKLFREANHSEGVMDSIRLLIHAHRGRAEALHWEGDLGGKAEQSFQKARLLVREELELGQELGRSRVEGAMLLSMAELSFLDTDEDHQKRKEVLKQAEDHAEKAVAKFQEAQDPKMQVVAQLQLARLRLLAARGVQSGSYLQAREASQQALAAATDAKDARGEALARLQIIAVRMSEGDFQEARTGLSSGSATETPGAKTLRASLICLLSQRELQDNWGAALRLSQEAYNIFQDIKYAKGWEAASLGVLVEALILSGQKQKAQEEAEKAVANLKQRDPKESARAMHHLVHAMVANGQEDEAMRIAKEAVETSCQDLADHHSEVALYMAVSEGYMKAKRYNQASDAISKAERGLAKLGTKRGAETLKKALSSLQAAIKTSEVEARQESIYNQNQNILQRAKEEPLVDYSPEDVGDYDEDDAIKHARSFLETWADHMKNERNAEALKAATIAVDLFYDNEDKRGEAQALLAVSAAHIAMENYKMALWAVKSSLENYRELQDKSGHAEALHALASVHNHMGNPREALTVAYEGLGIYQSDLEDGHGMIKMYFVIIDSYAMELEGVSQIERETKERYKTNIEKALSAARKASKLCTGLSFDDLTEACTAHYLATAYMLAGKYRDVVQASEEAVFLFKNAGEETGQVQAMATMGEALMAMKKITRAKSVLNEALKLAKDASYDQVMDNINALLTQINAQQTLAAAAVAMPTATAAGAAQVGDSAAAGQAQMSSYVAPTPEAISARVLEMVRDLSGEEGLDEDTPFMDAGIDSLASVELRTNLQKAFGIQLPSTVMFNYPTKQSISEYIADEMAEAQVSLK